MFSLGKKGRNKNMQIKKKKEIARERKKRDKNFNEGRSSFC